MRWTPVQRERKREHDRRKLLGTNPSLRYSLPPLCTRHPTPSLSATELLLPSPGLPFPMHVSSAVPLGKRWRAPAFLSITCSADFLLPLSEVWWGVLSLSLSFVVVFLCVRVLLYSLFPIKGAQTCLDTVEVAARHLCVCVCAAPSSRCFVYVRGCVGARTQGQGTRERARGGGGE